MSKLALSRNGCGATDGVIGIAIETYLSCSSGKPIAIMYQDTSCSKPFGDNNITQNNSFFSVGPTRHLYAFSLRHYESQTADIRELLRMEASEKTGQSEYTNAEAEVIDFRPTPAHITA